ncbi:hypothetical protein [Methanolobus tindarius]|uniref:hypothetical protein n=1 Tax=Methanolobus tindarius TaxID=2221 RepID=UPI00064F2813|nr:hypothetical protein [Methanolobus tindarius]
MKSKNCWVIALGEQSFFWEECRKGNFIVIGWGKYGDPSKYHTYEELKEHLINLDFSDMTPIKIGNMASQIWKFTKIMDEKDIVIVRRGQSRILEIGKVKSKQYYDSAKLSYEIKSEYYSPNIDDYKNAYSTIRDVTWLANFPPEGIEVSKHQDWIRTLIEIKDEKLKILLSELENYDISLDVLNE